MEAVESFSFNVIFNNRFFFFFLRKILLRTNTSVQEFSVNKFENSRKKTKKCLVNKRFTLLCPRIVFSAQVLNFIRTTRTFVYRHRNILLKITFYYCKKTKKNQNRRFISLVKT